MMVFELRADANRFANLEFVHERDYLLGFERFDGSPMLDGWAPVEVRVVRSRKGRVRRESDFPSLHGSMAVFSERATVALRPLLASAGELLPLHSPDGSFLAFNVTRFVDALDEERSLIHRFGDGRVMHVERYSFFPDRLGDAGIFKIPQVPKGRTFVSERFVRLADEAGLVGFHFHPVWSPEPAVQSVREERQAIEAPAVDPAQVPPAGAGDHPVLG